MTKLNAPSTALNDPPEDLVEVPFLVQQAIQTVKRSCQVTHDNDLFPSFKNVLILISTTDAGYSFGTGTCTCASCIDNLRLSFERWADRINAHASDTPDAPAHQVH